MNLACSLQHMVCGSRANVQLDNDECFQHKQHQVGHDLDPMLEFVAADENLDQLLNVQLENDACFQHKQDQGGNDLDPMLELIAVDENLDQLCHSVAEDLSMSLIHSLEYAHSDENTMASHSPPSSGNLRKLYLNMVSDNACRILEMLAAPLKQKLLQNSFGAELLQGSRAPIRISQGCTSTSDCLVIEKEAFSIGRHTICDVQLLDRHDLQCSRIHLCIFNLPRCILVVDGWSITGTSVELRAEEQAFSNNTPGFLCLVPHGTPATLHVGSQRLHINPAQDGKSSPYEFAQGSKLTRLPGGTCMTFARRRAAYDFVNKHLQQ